MNLDQLAFPGELIVDSFAGGGGASLGIEMALGRSPDIAINHDAEALALHAANHPTSKHYHEDVWKIDPRKACDGRPVGLMWLSPDCKHFSKAKGGKPVSKQIRSLAWVAIRWAKAVKPRIMVLENVEEFQDWGPVLRETNRPCPKRKGQTFRAFVRALERLRYRVEWKQLRACDYGAPTIRRRLFLIARRDGQPIVWPAPTHGAGRLPWRTAAECIDWSIACPSIFERERPLADNTLRRIARGIQKFVIDSPKPFIVRYHSAKRAGDDRIADLGAPLPTQSTENRFALAAPFLKPRYGEDPNPKRRGGLGQAPRVRSVDQPIPTIVPTTNGADLVAAFLAKHQSERHEGEVQSASLDSSAPTVKCRDSNALVTAHIAKHYGGRVGSAVDGPLHTVTAESVHHALVASHIEVMHSQSSGASHDAPLQTVMAHANHFAEVRAFLAEYYGGSTGSSLHAPAHTATSRDRFALVTVEGVEYAIVDVGMRMLAPRELYRAQGFPDSYRIDIDYNGKPMTKTAQVRMCGNSVCPPVAAAIVAANADAASFAPGFGRERVA